MAANETAGKKEGEGRPEPSPQNSGTGELSEEEIMKKLTIAQQRERLIQQLQQIEEEEKQLSQKIENARDAIFTAIKKKYNMNEDDLREAFGQLLHGEDPVILSIIEMCEKKGADALKEKEFKQNAELIRKMHIVKNMDENDVKKVSIYIREAHEYMERKQITAGKNQIHHTGRMSEEAIKMLLFVKEQGGRVSWKEFKEYGKTLGLDTDTLNKRRWGLINKQYLKREGNELVLTQKGYARLEEEGY